MTKESKVAAVPSIQYSDKLQSLLSFLDEHCEPKHDCRDEPPGIGGGKTGVSPSRSTRTGLADITNASSKRGKAITYQDKEELKDCTICFDVPRNPSAKPQVMHEKKYIWDDWCETGAGDMVLLQDEPGKSAGGKVDELGASRKGLPINAQQQLAELRSMRDEIHMRFSGMKSELEQKSKSVQELHSIRVKNEAEHVQKIKSAKQEWKKRLEVAKAERDMTLNKHERLKVTLQNDCELLEKDVTCGQAEIERSLISEQDTGERLRRDAVWDLEEAKKSWQHLEREERKKRDQKMSPKLKRDAAKAVEPKLRLLMEKNKEEVARLEREKARELDSYRLELYKRSNAEFKREATKIRDNERKRNETLEAEWIVKLESSGLRHEAEMKRLHWEHEQRAAMMKRQFNADKQKCIDEQELMVQTAKADSSRQMEDMHARHELDMTDMEDEYSRKMAQKQQSCSNEFKQWKFTRETALKDEEDRKLRDERVKMKAKIQSDIDLVKRKLKEEKIEKRQQMRTDMARNRAKMKEKHDAEIKRLKYMLNEATKESDVLRKKEAEESHIADELEENQSRMEESFRETKKQVVAQEQRLTAVVSECDEHAANVRKDGERKRIQARHEKEALEKHLVGLIEDHSKQRDEWEHMSESLKADNTRELLIAKTKVAAMIENKRSLLEKEAAKLLHLRQETAQLKM